VPTRSGFSFQGWYESSAFTGNPVTQITTGTNINKVFFAGWNPDISSQEKIISLSFGRSSSSAISSNGRVFAWGINNFGQLGDGTTNDKATPIEITSSFSLGAEDKIIYTSLGGTSYTHNTNQSSAISSTGRIFTWGKNDFGQLGDGTTTNRTVPTEITSRFSLATGDKIVAVSLGGSHSAVVSSFGRVFSWGQNGSGRLGDGTTTNRTVPTEITSRFNLAIGDKILSISLGDDHSSAMSSNGRVFTWGANSVGQLGDDTTTQRNIPTEITSRFSLTAGDKIVAISLGYINSSAISSTGRVFTWGNNSSSGRLGDGNTTDRIIPTEITSRFSLAAGDKIVATSLGSSHSSAISSTGRVFTWGVNSVGQLGDNTTGSSNNKSIPTEITSRFNLAAGDKIVAISVGNGHTSALSSSGRVFNWGSNSSGQLCDGTTGSSNNKSIPTEIKIID
jgi:uncharacterized repeat protein (TIGR02543 family)